MALGGHGRLELVVNSIERGEIVILRYCRQLDNMFMSQSHCEDEQKLRRIESKKKKKKSIPASHHHHHHLNSPSFAFSLICDI